MHNIGIFSVIFFALAAVVCLRVKEFLAMPVSSTKQFGEHLGCTTAEKNALETTTVRGRSSNKAWGIWMNQSPNKKIQNMIKAGATSSIDTSVRRPLNSSVTNGTMLTDLRLFEGAVSVRAGKGGADGKGEDDKGGDEGGGVGVQYAPPKELTVKIPMVKQNEYGQWVFDPWAATFGVMFLDTRFAARAAHTLPRVLVDSNPIREYYPRKKDLIEVCGNKSTLYPGDNVKEWLMRHLSKTKLKFRPFQMGLRHTMYTFALSEVCHSEQYSELLNFLQCSMLRHQRMEAELPKYAEQQKAIS
ncbi:uncharacterized protein LOC117592378 [Drosophila guanche]|uniref:Uncharacterized protein n=1 Tax=Drosophila guanche TaxID=7266 RepID=A0A3B0JS11_DROGU|nr:uncharacterized protein LOC117592378 [Drosophila guanche]SPP75481.1 Hypothetical predicted protein [Drosophila guanche]